MWYVPTEKRDKSASGVTTDTEREFKKLDNMATRT
jgi:hypothetical protein